VSFHFGFNHGGRIYVIKPAFAPAYGKYAPGLLQVKFLFEHAMELGVNELDFTTGEEPYKYRFSNHARVNYALRVHRLAMFHGLDRALRYAKAVAKRSPQLARLGRRVKPFLEPTLHRLGL
jgi:CelD/BcsL family acetyltransferase involved in cellulose biosynthesis